MNLTSSFPERHFTLSSHLGSKSPGTYLPYAVDATAPVCTRHKTDDARNGVVILFALTQRHERTVTAGGIAVLTTAFADLAPRGFPIAVATRAFTFPETAALPAVKPAIGHIEILHIYTIL